MGLVATAEVHEGERRCDGDAAADNGEVVHLGDGIVRCSVGVFDALEEESEVTCGGKCQD